MSTFFAGPGGSDAADGLTWATRKLTAQAVLTLITGAAAGGGHKGYLGPGTYRELLTIGVSGGAAYTTGTVAVTQGSAVVTGSGTTWSTNLFADGQIKITGYGPREILSVDSNTQVTLKQPFPGATASGLTYTAWRDNKLIGDVTGEHTDGLGGIVRITGSDNDQTATRANCITSTSRTSWTIRGLSLYDTTSHMVSLITTGANWIIEDYFCSYLFVAAVNQLNLAGTGTNITVRRGLQMNTIGSPINFIHTVAVDNAGHLVENVFSLGGGGAFVRIDRIGGGVVRNCYTLNTNLVRIQTDVTAGQVWNVNNCQAIVSAPAVSAITLGTIVEDYNNFWTTGTARTNVNTGANSVNYPPVIQPPIMLSGFRYPWNFGEFHPDSLFAFRAGSGEANTDLWGRPRPITSAKNSWGPVQSPTVARSTTQAHNGTYSLRLADAGRVQLKVPVTNVSTTFDVYVYREANYAGTNPQMVIKQPGQADVIVTDAAAAGQWNLLTSTMTPAALPPYVFVELVSSNTASSGSYNTYFDDFLPH